MCAGERSELSRGVDGLTKAVVPDDPEVSAKSPGVWYKSLNGVVLEFCVISNGSDREAIVREPGEYLGVQQRRREKKKVGIHKKNPKGAATHVPKGCCTLVLGRNVQDLIGTITLY